MKTWIQLSPDQAHSFYCIPLEITTIDDNIFFGLEGHPYDLDGPWPLLVLLRDKFHPEIVDLHIFSVSPEAQEYEGFNPLTETGGHLALNRQELSDLVGLLQRYTQQLPSTHGRREQQMLKKIENSKLSDFHLHPEWFPNSEQNYYYQIYDPLYKSEENLVVTILLISIGPTRQTPSRLFLQIASFPLQKLQDRSFNPLENAIARIHLDWGGIQELTYLLQSYLAHLVA